jgi:hypothetical protein
MTSLDLTADLNRVNGPQAGILVRAKCNDQVGTYDIATLDRVSLIRWLRHEGGKNELAENILLALLGHGPLTSRDADIVGQQPTT